MIHYLLTIQASRNMHIHSYVMCNDRRYVKHVAGEMLDVAEQHGLNPLNIVLMTELSTGVDVVRGILSKNCPETKRYFETATNFHRSVWVMSTEHPDDAQLMKLH